jgi:phospholipid/cholesterol/gamma-HCH transport system substrate-binding protein
MQKRTAVITGIFVLLGIVILVITIFTLGGQHETFVKKQSLRAVFDDINGLQKGNNIWFSGVKIGTVKSIKLEGNGIVDVALNIDKEAMQYIRKDSKVKISTDGLIGNKIVVVYGGTNSAPPIADGDLLGVEKMTSTDEMVATLQANNKNLLAITDNFKKISKNIADGQGTIGTLINDKTLVESMQSAVSTLQAAVDDIKVTSAKSNEFMGNLVAFSKNLNNENSSIHRLMADTSIYSSVNGGVAKFKEAAASAAAFADTLKITASKLNQNNSPVGMLLNDNVSADNLRVVFKNLATSSQKLDEDLEALQHNFLLRGFFKHRAKDKADNP